MTIHWDPWHTVTVTAITSVADEAAALADGDYDLVFDVKHPAPHENGCPENCMTQQEIDGGLAEELPTTTGVYQIRAWGEYWPATLAGDAAEFDGGIEVLKIAVGAPVEIYYSLPDPFTGRAPSLRRVPCHVTRVDPDYFWVKLNGDNGIGNDFRFRIDTLEAHDFNYGWRVVIEQTEAVAR